MVYSGSGLHFSLCVCQCIFSFFHDVACANIADVIIRVQPRSLAAKKKSVSLFDIHWNNEIYRKVQMCIMLDVAQRRATM